MPRRDAFSTFRQVHPDENATLIDASRNFERIDARQPLDMIPTAQRKKKRNRDWEKARQAETVTYRGVPPAYHEWMGQLAAGMDVPRDEVVRAFLEYSLGLYQSGKLILSPQPKAQHMTLFPKRRNSDPPFPSMEKKQDAWMQQAFPVPEKKQTHRKNGKRGNKETSRWQQRVTYRIPVELKSSIRSIAQEHTLPLGEVVWYFIEKALKAYQAGSLPLMPEPRIVGATLFSGD